MPDAARLQLLVQRDHALLTGGHLHTAQASDELIRADYGDEAAEQLYINEALITLLHGRAADAEMILADAIATSRGPADYQSVLPVWVMLAAQYAHPPQVAHRLVAAARSRSDSYAARTIMPYQDTVLGSVCVDAGWWDDAVAVLDPALDLAQEIGTCWMANAHGIRAQIDVHRGNLGAARERLDTVAARGFPSWLGMDLPGQAELLLLEQAGVQHGVDSAPGESSSAYEAAADRAAVLWGAAHDQGSELWQARIAVDVWRTARPDVRADLADAIATWSHGQLPGWDPVRDLIAGLAADDLAGASAAAEELATVGNALTAAQAREEVGVAYARAEDVAQSRDALRKALEAYDALNATVDATRLRARAARLGVRTGGSTTRSRSTFGWDALTTTERTVAGHVQEGLTNPQIASILFLSPRTVQTHVSHILRKTGLHSRVEIATQRARHLPQTAT